MSSISDNFTASSVYVVRHGERIDHVNPNWKASALNPDDPYLTEKGIQQAAALGNRLKSANLSHIFSSPFYRTVQTANEVAKVTNVGIKIENGLSEWLNGDWFGVKPKLQTPCELKKKFPLVDDTYTSLMPANYPETREMVIERCGEIARKLAKKYKGKILLVGHGIVCEFTVVGITEEVGIPYITYCALQSCKLSADRSIYTIEGSKKPDISFMAENIRPVVKTGYR